MSNNFKAIFWGGFWCGVLDFLSAAVSWGIAFHTTPIRIGQSIAAGLLGREAAVAGAWKTALLGVVLHFFIAFSAATVYWLASRKLRLLTEKPILSGLIYGELVFLFMNMVVLPLSAIHADPLRWTSFSPWPTLVTGPIGHPFLVGLPIALAISKWSASHGSRSHALGAGTT
jgi:uncharacterized membrane protein YagU involved in acid resistance